MNRATDARKTQDPKQTTR